MSAGIQPSLFFLGLPDLRKLCCVTLTVNETEDELRSRQIKICRELVLMYPDILASPAIDSFNEITVVMAVQLFQKGILQAFGERRSLQLSSPQRVYPGVLQCCLSYSLITRLSPTWNKAGLYLVTGKDFLTERGRLNAVSMELSTSEGQLCISIDANTVRLPPINLEDFDLPPLVMRKFCSDPDSVLDCTIWCHVLPSMKKGQIIAIRRRLPKDGPFRTYRDLQDHWSKLYGYRLPELAEDQVVYCSIYFKLVGQRLFTYPLSCVRLQPIQRSPRVDLQTAIGSFQSDIREKLTSVCGVPAKLTRKPCYPTAGLNSASTIQVLSGEEVNLTKSSSNRPVLTHRPPAPPTPQTMPYPGSQPPAWTPLSQQGTLGGEFNARFAQSQGSKIDNSQWRPTSPSPSNPAPSQVSYPFADPTCYKKALSSFSAAFQSASSFPSLSHATRAPENTPSSTRSIIITPDPKLVPIFKNKCASRHVNVALLRDQKQKEQMRKFGGLERGPRVSLPAFKKTSHTPNSYPNTSSMAPFTAAKTHPFSAKPRAAPSFESHQQKVKHLSSLSPLRKYKPATIVTPNSKAKSSRKDTHVKGTLENKMDDDFVEETGLEGQSAVTVGPPKPLVATERGGVMFESKPKKPKPAIRDVDVEKIARNNQLSKLNAATLLAWLKARGATVSTKTRKEELMLKVMSCLAEA